MAAQTPPPCPENRARLPVAYRDRIKPHLVSLRHQDRGRWDHQMIAEANDQLGRAAQHRRLGPYQLQTAIVACHADAGRW